MYRERKMVPKTEQWDHYSSVTKFNVVERHYGERSLKAFYSLEEAEFYRTHLRTVEDNRNNLVIVEKRNLTMDRIVS